MAREINGMAIVPFAQQIAEARERVIQAAADALDAELARFIIPADKIAMLEDFAKFACFLAALKVDEVRTACGQPIDKRGALRAWFPLGKSLYRDVPAMLLDYGIEAHAAHLKGTADAAE